MAIESSGIDDLAEMLKDLGELGNGELVEKMLRAGAEPVVDNWRKVIRRVVKTRRSTGDMERSVAPDKKVKIKKDISTLMIYPQGKDRKGVRNAEKAYIHHYGKSGQRGSRFVDDVERESEEEAIREMERVFDEYMKEKGVVD